LPDFNPQESPAKSRFLLLDDSLMKLECPHCGSTGKIRTSRNVTNITREAYVQCENVNCFHSWVEIFSVIRTLQPSLTPNPLVYIPMSAKKRQEADGAQLELPLPVKP
jgi:ssDNA-binding Zn-finger/Zn-ribbon topoisomerase 1